MKNDEELEGRREKGIRRRGGVEEDGEGGIET